MLRGMAVVVVLRLGGDGGGLVDFRQRLYGRAETFRRTLESISQRTVRVRGAGFTRRYKRSFQAKRSRVSLPPPLGNIHARQRNCEEDNNSTDQKTRIESCCSDVVISMPPATKVFADEVVEEQAEEDPCAEGEGSCAVDN